MRTARAQISTAFFWSDWISDHCLRRCSFAARGLWMDILCIAGANDGAEYGFALIGGKPVPPEHFCNAMTTVDEVKKLLKELEDNGVFSKDRKGVIYCRRMVRAQKNRKNGRLGTPNNPLFSFAESEVGGAGNGTGIGTGTELDIGKGRSKGKERFAARCKMPDDWYPDAFGIAYAKEHGYSDDRITKLVLQCKNYHISKGTLIAGDRGLAATWRMWITKEVEFDHQRNERNGNKLSFADIARGKWDS